MKLNLRRLILALLLGVIIYGAFVVYAGFRTITESLQRFDWWAFAGAIGLSTTNYGIRFVKWQYYLRVLGIRGVKALDSLLIFLSGFVLTITPGKVGEVFKSAILSRTHGVPGERSSPIVIAERITDVIAIIVLILLGSITFHGGLLWAVLGICALFVGFVGIFWKGPREWVFRRMSTGWMAGVVPRLRTAFDQLQTLTSPSALLVPTALSVVGWGCEGYALLVLLDGFGQQVELAQAVFFYSTATLAGALIPVPGGLGVTETLMQEQLVRVGSVAQGPATSSMLLVRIATLWWAVVVGFVALGILRTRFPQLTRGRNAT